MNVESTRGYTKWQWKNLVRKYVNQKNPEETILKTKGYKRVSHEKYSTERFEQKEYFYKLNPCVNVDPSSMWDGNNTKSYSNNFTREQQNKSNNMRQADIQFHDFMSGLPEDLRQKYDTKEDKQLVEFFKEIVKKIIKNGED